MVWRMAVVRKAAVLLQGRTAVTPPQLPSVGMIHFLRRLSTGSASCNQPLSNDSRRTAAPPYRCSRISCHVLCPGVYFATRGKVGLCSCTQRSHDGFPSSLPHPAHSTSCSSRRERILMLTCRICPMVPRDTALARVCPHLVLTECIPLLSSMSSSDSSRRDPCLVFGWIPHVLLTVGQHSQEGQRE